MSTNSAVSANRDRSTSERKRPVAELAVVAASFHTKPLRRFLQSVGHYQVLGLSLQKIGLFAENRDTLDEIDPIRT